MAEFCYVIDHNVSTKKTNKTASNKPNQKGKVSLMTCLIIFRDFFFTVCNAFCVHAAELKQDGEGFSVSQSAFSVKVYIRFFLATYGISRLKTRCIFFVDLSDVSEISERNVFRHPSSLTFRPVLSI